MREEMETFWRKELRYLAIRTRSRLHLTQREMGARLEMCESSYSDIETGRTACGMLTAILLINMQEEPQTFLREANNNFEAWLERTSKETFPV